MPDSGAVLVLIPTYNEAANISSLVKEVLTQEGVTGVIVVDDNSPDGTGDLVDALRDRNPGIHLIRRPAKLGLGTAYLEAFDKAAALKADAVVTMDADFSHSPEAIPSLLKGLEEADLVIGSRYIPGGRTKNWGIGRRLLSGTANLLARRILNLKPADCTSGFRAYRGETLQALPLGSITSDGYSFLIELLFLAQAAGMTVKEVPITFTDRREGKSKISRQEILKAVKTLFRLRGRMPGPGDDLQ